jgi:succinoglycan biosynthesis protein ExoO
MSCIKAALRKLVARFSEPRQGNGQWLETSWGNPATEQELVAVRSVLGSKQWNVVMCNYCWLSGCLNEFDASTCKAVLTHDIWNQHVSRQSSNIHLKYLDFDAEKRYLNQAEVVVGITQNDCKELERMIPGKKIVCAPMACTPSFSQKTPIPSRLMFIGSAYLPNIDGIEWFLTSVAPILRLSGGDKFELHLVGKIHDAYVCADPEIRTVAKGWVDDLAEEYFGAEIVIVPILGGTGMKIKLVEALAHGKAILTTSEGARGLEFLAGTAFLVADTAEDFANGIIRIASDPNLRLALEAGARAAALDVLSPESCFGPLRESFVKFYQQFEHLRCHKHAR